MPTFGYILLLIGLVLSTYAACSAILGHHLRNPRLALSSQYASYGVFGVLTCSSAVLTYLFLANDYSVKYVQHYSDRSMSLFYKATAFWGGQDGSMLFWVWVLSVWGAIAVYQNRNRNQAILPYSIVALMGVNIFFLVTIIFAANPFETYLTTAPTDGQGLNPLLQNPYMVTHPPTLYLGYIGWTIPFCFAIGALAHGRLDYEWIASMRRWCLVAWAFLTIGLTLGGLWAYEELGWGGYWAWDPVENAAFIPWLTGTAFIHSIQVQERRQMFKAWNLLLIILTFIFTVLGTMMTRSGVVQSVHAFAQSNIGAFFTTFLIITIVVSFGLMIWRMPKLRPQHALETTMSREFAFLANNWILLVAAFFVTFATLFPSLFKAATGQEVNVGPSFFNQWMVPIGLVLLFLTGVGPMMSWRKSTWRSLYDQLAIPSILAAGVAIALVVWGVTEIAAVATFALCTLVVATLAQEFVGGVKHRLQKSQNENAASALVTVVQRAKRRYGGYVVHFGMALWFFGFGGNAFKVEEEINLSQGETAVVGDYELRFDGLSFDDDGQKKIVEADISVFSAGSGKEITTMTPARWFYRKPEDQVTTEVRKLSSFKEDLYLVLGGFDSRQGTAALQVKVNPLVNFVWLGTAFMMLGFGIAAWPERQTVRVHVPIWRRVAPVAVSTACIGIAVWTSVAAFTG